MNRDGEKTTNEQAAVRMDGCREGGIDGVDRRKGHRIHQ